MTRINTNVSSLVAQKNLQRSNAQLQTSLTRLSTGLRINVGKDDPAGLIASEALRSDIISVEKAISNSERANQLIATADSALGQVSSLLNDIRGLVTEAANVGALSDDQIAANQLQVDSSLEAIDRISQITSFQGRRLLDGNLDFITAGVDSAIQDLQIDQANFGTVSQIAVGVDVVAQATQGQLTFNSESISDGVVLQIAGSSGTEAFNFASGSTIEEIAVAVNLVSDALGVQASVNQDVAIADQAGSATVSSFGLNNDFTITADVAGATAGDLNIKFIEGAAGDDANTGDNLSVAYVAPAANTQGTVEVTLKVADYTRATATFSDAVTANTDFTITARQGGDEFNGVTVDIASVTGTGTGAATSNTSVSYNHTTKVITASLATGSVGVDDLEALIDGDAVVGALFDAATSDTANMTVATANGTTANGADGGDVTTTALEVVNELNKTVANGGIGDDFTATLVAGNDGSTAVDAFENFVLTGNVRDNNRLQFLGPDGAKNVSIVANGNDTALSLDLSTTPATTALASAIVAGDLANSTFEIKADNAGGDYDDVEIFVIDNGTGGSSNYTVYDEKIKRLTISVNLDEGGGGDTAATVTSLINGDSYVSSLFTASNVDGDGSGRLADANVGSVTNLDGGVTDPGTIIVNLATDSDGNATTTAAELAAFFDTNAASAALQAAGISVSSAEGSDGSGIVATGELSFGTNGQTQTDAQATVDTRATSGINGRLNVTAVGTGAAYNDVSVVFADTATAASETFSYDTINKTLTIGIESGVTDVDDIIASFTGSGLEGTFTLARGTGGDGSGVVTDTDSGVLAGGVVTSGTVEGAALLGNLDEGDLNGDKLLDFQATTHGSDSFVSIKALTGSFATTDTTGATSERSVGTDVNARINGIQAIGKGLRASLNTSSLNLSFSLDGATVDGASFSFNITGGGALFQLGPDVVSNQQARLGIQSVSTATLGGVSGRLFELRSGGDKALNTNVGGAAAVVEEVIGTLTGLRGRLGAFQKTTLETNIFTLSDTLANLTDAESSIRDADFAAESARLTRAQILVQSGTSVLGIANSNPQNVLALLR